MRGFKECVGERERGFKECDGERVRGFRECDGEREWEGLESVMVRGGEGAV